MDYDESAVLTAYIWDHYQHLMTNLERETGRAIIGRQKAANTDSPKHARLLQERFGRLHRDDVNALLQDGADAFRQRVRDRLLQAHPKCLQATLASI